LAGFDRKLQRRWSALIRTMALGILLIMLFLLLVGIGALVLVLVVGSLIMFLPATIVAFIVLLLTGSWAWAGLAFLMVALLMVLFK